MTTSGDVDAVRFMAGEGFSVEEIASTVGLDAAEVEAVLAGRHQVSAVPAPVVEGAPVRSAAVSAPARSSGEVPKEEAAPAAPAAARSPLLRDDELFADEEWAAFGGGVGWSIAPF